MAATIGQLGGVTSKNKAATQVVLDAATRAGHIINQVWGVGGGDHAGGMATDFMVYNDRAAGDWIADYLWENRLVLGVRWIIWRQRIRSTTPGKSGQWEAMADRGNATQNHMDHVHVVWNGDPVKGITDAIGDVAAAITGTYKVRPGDTLGSIAAKFKVTVADLVKWNGIANPNAIQSGQTLQLKGPAGVAVQPKEPVKPGPFVPLRNQRGAYIDLLRPGQSDSTSVYLYQLALRRYLNKYANKYNPNGATGTYGPETVAMTKAVYRDLAKKQPRGGWTPEATWPGPALLKALGLANLGHS